MFGNTSFGNTSFGNTTFGAGFGGTPTLGAFGSPSQTTTQPTCPVGTTTRFVPLTGTDSVAKPGSNTGPTQITTRHQNISAMKEYESKSVDELRLEDYAANRKVGSLQNNLNMNTFNTIQSPSSQQNTSIFGTNNQSNLLSSPFQNQNTSIFGQKTGFDTGSSSTNLFGQTLNKPQTTTSNSIFSINSFNQTPKLGQPQTNQISSPFGTTPFNSMQPSTSQQGNTSIFSTNTQPSLMSSPFQSQPQNTSIFGQKTGFETNTSTSNLFGPKPQTTTPSSIFNINSFSTAKPAQPQTGQLQNTFNTGVSSTPFGATTSQPANNSIFGMNSQSNLFSAQPQNPASSIFGMQKTGFETNTSTNNIFNTSLNKPQTTTSNSIFSINSFNQAPKLGQPQTNQLSSPFGATPFNTMQPSTAQQGNTSIFSTNTQPSLMSSPFQSQPQNTSIFGQKTGFEANTSTTSLFDTKLQTTTANSIFNVNSFSASKPAQPQTDLLLNRLTTLPYGETSLFLSDTSGSNSFTTDPKTINYYKMSARKTVKLNKPASTQAPRVSSVLFDDEASNDDMRCAIEVFQPKKNIKKLELKQTSFISEGDAMSDVSSFLPSANNSALLNQSGVINTRPDYVIKPTLEELERLFDSERDVCIVDSFLIERPNYGSILFTEPLDLKGINLDETVHIRRKEVVVYPDDARKPPIGHGLNRPATVTLHQVWPVDKSTNSAITDVDRLKLIKYPEKIMAATSDKNARFIDYKPETGTWVFAVKHFSKYGITDDDEDTTNTTVDQYKISPKIKPKLKGSPNKSNSILFDNFYDTIDEENDSKMSVFNRSLPVHGTKRLALQNVSMNERPIVDGATVPKQQKIRDIKLKPDLHSARNKLQLDIMSVCVAGSPKVRFFNGSRKFCYVQDDTIVIQELKLVPSTSSGALEENLRERFENFLEKNSMVTALNMSPTLAPYIETYDFIPNASSHDLLDALYGNLSSKTPYSKQDERLTRVIRWLAATNRKLPPPSNLYQQIIYHMSCDRYDLAANLAVENRHPRLALLVSTLNINENVILSQLTSWRQSGADQYVDIEMLKIYVLLSKQTEWKISNDSIVDCLKELSWTQKLCLLALHVVSLRSDQEKYGFHMLPVYIKKLGTNINEVDYHILARHSPANIISAAENLVEEWFLLESLKSFHVINSEFECNQSDMIHCNLTSQLGPIDLRWACFVALHIINNEVRNQVLIQCLEQNYEQLSIELKDQHFKTVEAWLLGALKIPAEFIENSKNLAKKKM